jgi:hypothetical protein
MASAIATTIARVAATSGLNASNVPKNDDLNISPQWLSSYRLRDKVCEDGAVK